MVTYQTTVKDSNQLRFGSAKIEVGDDVGSLVDLGAAQDVNFSESFEVVYVVPHNAPKKQIAVKNHEASVAFKMMEINLANLNSIRGGFDIYDTVDGTADTATDEPHVLTGVKGVRLNNKNADGSIVTISGAKDAAGTAAVRNTDYVAYVDSEGYTCVARIEGSLVLSDGDTIKVSYGYTPAASRTLSSGGKNTINPKVVRLTNVNAAGKKFEITVYAATAEGGIELEFPADDGDEPMMPEITLVGVCDATRTAGDQLFKIVDEQGA
jgi:hypothetical protein